MVWYTICGIILCDSVRIHHFLFPMQPIFISSDASQEIIIVIGKWLYMYFLAIYPQALCVTAHWAYQCPIFNCSASMYFALECSSVFTYLYMAHGCAIPSIMFYQHMCTAFCWWNYLNYLSFWIISVAFIFILRMIHSNAICSPLVFITDSFDNFKTAV